jgi:quercetin dioxygenase-like cupin family protein
MPVASSRRLALEPAREYRRDVTYTLLHEGDPSIESIQGVFFKMRRALGTTAFGINEVRVPPGAAGQEHDEAETGHEEVYVVLDGTGTFTIEGQDVAVTAGDYLLVPAPATRQVTGGPEGMRFIVVGAQPKPSYDGRESL